ncbi:hypothetical protein Pmani_014080 [Petrolisthes manimaculis]|uniref:RNase H type-1 domain-containing protein n=1 Tax=Petrolisthes manimaculis TaxID=1843537 RepID=A0AAE1UDG0_9EUCA|nr:hypothetical protein Pmani_014080 [Petrolisthes manimaculis]
MLHTDSRAGLQALQQPHPKDNVGLITTILGILQSIAAQGLQVKLNWIPSHVGVRGNETADAAVKRAAGGPQVTRHVSPQSASSKGTRQARRSPACPPHTPATGSEEETGGLNGDFTFMMSHHLQKIFMYSATSSAKGKDFALPWIRVV